MKHSEQYNHSGTQNLIGNQKVFSIEMKSEIISLCKKHKVKSIALFGSLASNTMHSESDADFLVEFHEDLNVMDYADNYFSLLEELQRLIGRKVDLVTGNSLKNSILIEEINNTKVVLYAA